MYSIYTKMQRQNISIYSSLAAVSSFTKNIYSKFIPDTLIVKNLYFTNDETSDAIVVIKSNIVGDDNVMGFVQDGRILCNNPVSFSGRMLSGTYTFSFTDVDDVVVNLTGDISFQLELIKYT